MPKYDLICGRSKSNFRKEQRLMEHLKTCTTMYFDRIEDNVNMQTTTSFFPKHTLPLFTMEAKYDHKSIITVNLDGEVQVSFDRKPASAKTVIDTNRAVYSFVIIIRTYLFMFLNSE
jgi:hypothetical protein